MNACTSIFALTLVLTLTLLLSQTEGIQMKSTLYARKDNCRVDQSQESPLCVNGTCRGGRTACVVACSTHAQCTSVNIRSSDGLCMGVGNPLYGFRSKISTDTDWKNFSPDTRDGNTYKRSYHCRCNHSVQCSSSSLSSSSFFIVSLFVCLIVIGFQRSVNSTGSPQDGQTVS